MNTSFIGWPRLLGGAALFAAAWGLPLAPVCAQAASQTAPAARWQVRSGGLVYLDGQLSSTAALQGIKDEDLASVEGLLARDGVGRAFADSTATEVLVLTTKANANSPATLALADRAHLSSAFIARPASWQLVAPAALAYITTHYPKHWLGGELREMTRKSTGAVTYRVQLADNWGFRYVSFTAAGEFVPEGRR